MAKLFPGATIFREGHGRISTPDHPIFSILHLLVTTHRKHFLSLSESVKMGFTKFVSDSSLTCKTFITNSQAALPLEAMTGLFFKC